MNLDIRTLVMLAAAWTLLMGLSLRYVLREHPAELYPSIRLWTLGILMQPTAWILYGLRYEIPDWLSIIAANTLLGLAFAKQIQALRLFSGERVDKRLIYAPVVAIFIDELIFTYALPSVRLRMLTATPFFAAQMAYGGLGLLATNQAQRRSRLLTAAAFLTLALVLTVRVVYESLRSGTVDRALATSPMQTLVFAFATFFPALATLGFVLMCSDWLHQELERQATRDPLTGICNRRSLNELSTHAIALAHRHARPLALLLVDADHFKRINDAHGHAAGDDALRLLALTLQTNLRSEDLLGRLGGEEFVIVLPESDTDAAMASAERLRRAVERVALAVPGQVLSLRISIGVASMREGDDFDTLLRRSDLAMYMAKNAGRNCVRGPEDLPGANPMIAQSA
jgi:diguanylate cyclase (GGDEF)-like protein